jgi:hypothetical protein
MKLVQIAALAVSLAAGPALADKVAIYQLAEPLSHCDEYNTLSHCDGYNKGSILDKSAVHSWIWGYLTAAAVYAGNDGMRGISVDETKGYIARYCGAHPEDMISKAADTLFESQAGRK